MLGPIFARELLTVPRSWGHYATRAAYLGGLWVVSVTAWLATLGWTRSSTLGELSRFGGLLFELLTYVQLALFLFFAALSCAASIAREKDRRTFVLLLMTDLRDTEIVLGKVAGSLLPILALQLASVPFLMCLVLLGGVGPEQVLQTAAVFFGTTFAAGTLGALVALWRERTFQTLALTVLALVLYLMLVRAVGAIPGLSPQLVAAVQQSLDPFAALGAVHESLLVEPAGLPTAYRFALVMLGLGGLLTLVGVWKLRVWNPSGEPIIQRDATTAAADKDAEAVKTDAYGEVIARASVHAAPGATRAVTGNPILWREVATRAYGRRPFMVKLAYGVVLALLGYAVLSPLVAEANRTPQMAALGLLPVGVLSLLLVTAQATTAITSERDTGALDLLLVTDLTATEFIFGKILGILYNTKEYLLPPLILAGVYAFTGSLATPPTGHDELEAPMNGVALLCVLLTLVVLLSFATILGIHVALRSASSQTAVVHSLSTIFFLTAGTLVCIALILINRRFEYQWGSFVFFLIAGVGGLWYVLSGDRPTAALTWAAWFCPLAVLYAIMTVLVGRPGSKETGNPIIPATVIALAFGFAISAMLVPLLSEFDVAMGRTSGGAD